MDRCLGHWPLAHWPLTSLIPNARIWPCVYTALIPVHTSVPAELSARLELSYPSRHTESMTTYIFPRSVGSHLFGSMGKHRAPTLARCAWWRSSAVA